MSLDAMYRWTIVTYFEISGEAWHAMLIVDNLTKDFGGIRAVNEVSLEVNQGEIAGMIGPNGSGKTTIFEVISGYYRPTNGRVFFKGERIDGLKPHQVLARGLARSFQGLESLGSFTVKEVVLLASLSRLPMPQAKEYTKEVLDLVGLCKRADVPVPYLTLPDHRALELAKVIATQSAMILLDEVMSGLSPKSTEHIVRLIRKLQEIGKTFLVVEHRTEIVMSLCERIIVLNYGKKIAEGHPSEVVNNKDVIEAYLGEAE